MTFPRSRLVARTGSCNFVELQHFLEAPTDAPIHGTSRRRNELLSMEFFVGSYTLTYRKTMEIRPVGPGFVEAGNDAVTHVHCVHVSVCARANAFRKQRATVSFWCLVCGDSSVSGEILTQTAIMQKVGGK